MSDPLCQNGGMKIKKYHWSSLEKTSETLAFFGKAKLIRKFDGRHELVGGTAEDRTTARKWCSLFAPDVVFSDSSRHEFALVA